MNILEKLQDDEVAKKHLSNGLRYLDTDRAIEDLVVVEAAKDYYAIRSLRPDHSWLKYEMMGMIGTREYKLVRKSARELKKALKNYHTKRKTAAQRAEESDSPVKGAEDSD